MNGSLKLTAVRKRAWLSNNDRHTYLDTIKTKRTKIPTHTNWSSLHPDLLDKILNCLEGLKVKIQVKYTCRSWFSVTESHIRSFIETKQRSSPMLLISGNPKDGIDKHGFLISLESKLQKPLLHNMPPESWSIGSSGGWLLMLGKLGDLFVFHPTFGLKVPLPPIESFPAGFDLAQKISEHRMHKFILWGDPFLEKEFGVAVIYGTWKTIAYCKNRDTKWTRFDGSGKYYSDIIYNDGSIFALMNFSHIEKYRISDVPRKVMEVKPSSPNNITELHENNENLYYTQSYLVGSRDDLLLVVRCIGYYVYGGDNEVIEEADLIEEPYKFSTCPYKTTNFYVYKLNLKETEWEELSNLDDQMLFVGGNHSFSLSAKNYVWGKGNSIYFTDDNWDLTTNAEDLDDCECDFGGHDLGIFYLTKRRFEDIYVSDTRKIEPAFWILEC